MGAEWGMKNNVITTWYQGNGAEATQQNLGPQELPSHWHGEWRRTMLGSDPQGYTDDSGTVYDIVDPLSMWNAIEAIARGGQRLRVTWGVTTDNGDPSAQGSVVRDGRVLECKFRPARIQDIEWEIEFQWLGRGGVTPKVTSTRSNTVASDSSAYQNALNYLVDANQQAQLDYYNPTYFSLGVLEAVASLPVGLTLSLSATVSIATSDVLGAVTIAATLSSQPVAVQNNAITLAQDSVTQSNNFYDELSQTPYELLTQNSYQLSSLLFSFNLFAPQSDAAQSLAQEAQLFAAQLRQQVQGFSSGSQGVVDPKRLGDPNNILTIYTTKDGDTPALVSARMYGGSPDHAADICRANGLSWYTPSFTSGIQLVIPRLSSTNATQAI
jgi:phage tail protein X